MILEFVFFVVFGEENGELNFFIRFCCGFDVCLFYRFFGDFRVFIIFILGRVVGISK